MESVVQIEDKSNRSSPDGVAAAAAMVTRPQALRWAIGAGMAVSVLCAVAFWLGARGDLDAFAATDAAIGLSGSNSPYVEMPEIIANLSAGAAPRFVKVRAVLRAKPGGAATIRENMAPIRDLFISYLHALHPDEYYGAAGFERLRAGLRRRAELALGTEASALEDVLIVEFVRQ